MAWLPRYGAEVTLSACLLFSATTVLAQGTLSGGSPSNTSGVGAVRHLATADMREAEQAARDLAFKYLDLWSAPKQVTLASAASFYAPHVTFHGQRRTLRAVVAEKRRFAQRWPSRVYRHRPETTFVLCEADAARCTVRSSFDFEARNPGSGRRAQGVGEHELVMIFANGKPVIAAEDSAVVIRGHGNMTEMLKENLRNR